MFFKKTKTQVLAKADEFKSSVDRAVDELVVTRDDGLMQVADAMDMFHLEIASVKKYAGIAILCYNFLLFGFLVAILLFVL